MADRVVRRRRVLVAFDPCEAELADFEASARLAAGLNAELVGLLVEDASLIEAADLPVTHLIPAGCRRMAAMDAAVMRRAFRVAAVQARETLSAVADRWEVRWSFEVTQSGGAIETLSRLTADDLLALCGAARSRRPRLSERTARLKAETAPCPVIVLRREKRGRQPVAIVYEGGVATLDVGRDLARIYDGPLLIVAAGPDVAVVKKRERQALDWLADEGLTGMVQRWTTDDGRDLPGRLRVAYPSVVVIDRRGAVGGTLDLDRLADEAEASLVVLGSA